MALFKAIVEIAYVETPVPAGQTVGASSQVMVTLTGPAGVVNAGVPIPNATASHVFEHLTAGDYSVEVKQLDDAGNLVGVAINFPFTVVDNAPPATFMAPSAVTVSVQPE
jgi:hypothetical protein